MKGLRSNGEPGNMINHVTLSLAWSCSDYTDFHRRVGRGGRKESKCEGLDSYLLKQIQVWSLGVRILSVDLHLAHLCPITVL